jgi:DNA-binding response OmpR family regulator
MTISSPPRVLLGEDDTQMRLLVAEALRCDGFEVDEVGDGRRVLECVAQATSGEGRPYDLVISDVRMPAFDGFKIVGQLRAGPTPPPVILMTAFGDDDCTARAAQLGVTMFYKPFKLAHLREVARRILGWPSPAGTPAPA